MITENNRPQSDTFAVDSQHGPNRLVWFLLIFVVAGAALFFTMSTIPSSYDEGISLTGAMRVAAGQIPHRDFYAIYGPAQFYVLAGLFKLFGESILVERVLYAFFTGLIVACVYYITSLYCRKFVVAWATVTAFVWMFGLGAVSGSAIIPVSLLNMAGSALLLPMFIGNISKRKVVLAGALAGMSALFRYDTGVAMLGVQTCVIAFAVYLKVNGFSKWLKESASELAMYVAGFAIVTLPPALYYLSVAPVHDFLHDIVIYPGKYYGPGRSLPFPGFHLKTIDFLVVYLPIIIVAISLYIGTTGCLSVRREKTAGNPSSPKNMGWYGLLIAFGLLSFLMYFKGLVRISPAQMYLSILPSVLLVAVLYEHKASFGRWLAISVQCMLVLSIGFAGLSSVRQVRSLDRQHAWVLEDLRDQSKGTLPPAVMAWCHTANPLTKGLCFLPSIDRIDAVDFIDSHTAPGQTLFVANTRMDKIIENDNVIYFATQRMPATHWSHFDPMLQNRADVQAVMIRELEANKPPYVVLDSEFDDANEPNDSSKSTGVFLMDNYIRSHYRWVQATGVLSIWQRMPSS